MAPGQGRWTSPSPRNSRRRQRRRAASSPTSPPTRCQPGGDRGPVADGYDRALWARLTDTDLLGLPLDPQYGGAGLDAVALCLVPRESAKALARAPLLETAAATALQAPGSPEPRPSLPAGVARGGPGRDGADGRRPRPHPATTRPNAR